MTIKLSAVLAAWKSFDLNNTQHELDETASEITLRQDKSDVSRKKLVEQLKEFKKDMPDETRKLASLIKSFQNEVDSLSKRSKYAESAFLKNYQKFLDIIDPVPSLEYSIGLEKKICLQEELELENKRLKQTIEEYNEEMKEIKNQEVTIKTLREKLKRYEEQFDSFVNAKTEEIEKQYRSAYTEKEQLLLENHEHNEQKLKEAEDRYRSLQASLEQSQSELFEVKTKLEDITEAKSEEIEILMNDLERANHLASTYQKELTEMKKQCENTQQKVDNDLKSDMESFELSSLEAELSAKDKEIAQVISDMKSLENSMSNLKKLSGVQIQCLEDELHQAKSTIYSYEQKLLKQKDYDELKRELAIIKSIEFDCSDDMDDNLKDSNVSKSLELLLLEKNKTLQNENTSLKLQNDELSKKYEDLEKDFSITKSLNLEQQNLISQLETDLASVQSISPNMKEITSQYDLLSEAVKDIAPREIDQADGVSQRAPSECSTTGESPLHTESLLTIVSAQRERFKVRNEELEAEVAAKNNQIFLIQNEIDSLRADNLKLYEKIRFLQSYEGSNTSNQITFPESVYSSQYEKSLDPFNTFSQREKSKRYSSLSPFDKITFSIGQLVIKSKGARTATFIYVSLLHCLVFLVLYKFAFTESWKRDFYSDCAKKFAEHMHDVHGEN